MLNKLNLIKIIKLVFFKKEIIFYLVLNCITYVLNKFFMVI